MRNCHLKLTSVSVVATLGLFPQVLFTWTIKDIGKS